MLKNKPAPTKETIEIFLLEDDPILSQLFTKNLKKAFQKNGQNLSIHCFTNCIEAISALPDDCKPPALFILDVLLIGPDGFTFLNEIASYPDLSKIPVIIVSSLKFPDQTYESYNVVEILNKTTMTPQTLFSAVTKALKRDFEV
jgi:response regulator receiver domain